MYMENPQKILFIPLRKGLRQVREIILTPLNEKNKELKNLRNFVVYLQLTELKKLFCVTQNNKHGTLNVYRQLHIKINIQDPFQKPPYYS